MNNFKQGDKVFLNGSSRHKYLKYNTAYTITMLTGDWISFEKDRRKDIQYHPYDIFISVQDHRLNKINKLMDKICI